MLKYGSRRREGEGGTGRQKRRHTTKFTHEAKNGCKESTKIQDQLKEEDAQIENFSTQKYAYLLITCAEKCNYNETAELMYTDDVPEDHKSVCNTDTEM